MPTYVLECPHGHRFEAFMPLAQFCEVAPCPSHSNCYGNIVITAPLLVKASQDVCYDSPVTGEPITSWAARRNDLAKHGCRPYEDGMKQDYHQRLKDSETALDKAVDTHVEASIAKMPTKQRAKLYSELVNQGTDAIVVRK